MTTAKAAIEAAIVKMGNKIAAVRGYCIGGGGMVKIVFVGGKAELLTWREWREIARANKEIRAGEVEGTRAA